MKGMLAGWKGLIALVAVVAFALILAWLLQTAGKGIEAGRGLSPIETPAIASPTALPWSLPPTPLPPDYTPTSPDGTIPTATPYPGEIRPPSTWSTPTPLPISKTINLAKGLPDEDIMLWIVRRSDGTYEKYFLPVGQGDEYKQLLGLGPQDKIIQSGCLVPLPPSTPNVEFIPPETKVP
jgi:hypothetical protein